MPKPNFIPRNPHLPTSMDYQALRREGIRWLQQLSGRIWTDYNEHDPGVTLLEQICFALTDVAYRTNISIEKLLFYKGDSKKIADSNALYSPHEIYHFSPLTLTDYRILIIDRIEEVNNAWFEPADEDESGISCLYNIIIQVFNDVEEKEYESIKERVKNEYATHRNVGEDIEEIIILKPYPIRVSAHVGIASGATGEEVLSEVYYRLTNYFNPAVQFYTYEDLQLEGWSLERIFETPSFSHGFLKPEELHYRNTEFQVTKIAEIISTTPGVNEVQDLEVYTEGLKTFGNTIKIKSDYFLQLDIGANENIEMSRGGIHYNYDPSIVRHLFEVKLDKHKNANQRRKKWKFDPAVAEFRFEEISDFSSIQNGLPGIYGVGQDGLPDNATEQRQAQAKQLKGYLLLFDQVLANHLMQLQNIRELFSLEIGMSHTYYTKLPVDFPDLEQLTGSMTSESLQQIMNDFDDKLQRKERLLNHLLARFGEVFFTDDKVKSIFDDMTSRQMQERLIQLKSSILKNYVQLSSARATAFNYYEDSIDQQNGPTFKSRLSYHLNIEDHRQRSLVKHLSEMDKRISERDDQEVENDVVSSQRFGKVAYRKTSASTKKITFLIKGENWQEYLLGKGGVRSNYHILPKGKKYLVLFYSSKRDYPIEILESNSIETARTTIDKLVGFFARMSKKSEGFHVMEHILLRPYGGNEFYFQILDRDNAVLFQSVKSRLYEKEKNKADDAVIAGTRKVNYSRVSTKAGRHAIYLNDKSGKRLARLRGELLSEEAAVERIDELVDYFREVEGDYSLFQKKIAFSAVKIEGSKKGREFFNGKISLVFPAWVSRFQNEEFRVLLHKCVRQSLPAHISVNWVWLNIEDMRKFEKIQKEWFELRRNPSFDWKKLNRLSVGLTDILTKE